MRPSFPHKLVVDTFFGLKLQFQKVLDLIVGIGLAKKFIRVFL